MNRTKASLAALLCGLGVSGQVNGQCDPYPPSLVAWWPLDGDGIDIVGGYDGAVTGGSTFIDGVLGQALSVGGTGDGVEVPHAEALDFYEAGGGSRPFFIDFWFRVSAVGPFTHLFGKRGGCGGGIDYQVIMDTDGSLAMGGNFGTGVFTAANTVVAGEWTHFAAGYGGGDWHVYVNGVNVETSQANAPGDPSTAPLTIGRSGTCTAIQQDIDEAHVWDRVLSSCEVAALYDSGPSAICGYCPTDFNGDDSTDVEDLVAVILNWASCSSCVPACPGDADKDGDVDVSDLTAVILNWGPCEDE